MFFSLSPASQNQVRRGASLDEQAWRLADTIGPTALRVDPSPRHVSSGNSVSTSSARSVPSSQSSSSTQLRRYNTVSDLRPPKPPPKRVSSLPNIHEKQRALEIANKSQGNHGEVSRPQHHSARELIPREKTLIPSKYGYHPRSQSATFKRLDKARRIIDEKVDKQVTSLIHQQPIISAPMRIQEQPPQNSPRLTEKCKKSKSDFRLVRVGSMTLGMRKDADRISTASPPPNLPFNLDPEMYIAGIREKGIGDSSESSNMNSINLNSDGQETDFSSSADDSSSITLSSPCSTKRHIRVMLPLMLEEEEDV